MKKNKLMIRQLEDLKGHCEEMKKHAIDEGAAWAKDVEALNFAINAIKENIILKDLTIKQEKDKDKMTIALFGTVRNNNIMEIGLRQNKSMEEINEMAIEAMQKIVNGNLIDFERIAKSYNEGLELYQKLHKE